MDLFDTARPGKSRFTNVEIGKSNCGFCGTRVAPILAELSFAMRFGLINTRIETVSVNAVDTHTHTHRPVCEENLYDGSENTQSRTQQAKSISANGWPFD